uniref:Major sperm protein n=1 Tax=Elaeophora elaphi TaxID=1147741 RepID=A0A0R3S015_9BILA
MSARMLRYLHEKSGADECYLAITIISGISIYLIIGDYARFVANAILTAVPILLTCVYPEEKPPFDNLLCYWSIFVIATLFFDPDLEDKGSYYWIKMLLLILLIVFPGSKQRVGATSKEKIQTILKDESLFAEVQSNQISPEKRETSPLTLQMKPELDFGTESSTRTASTSELLIVTEDKRDVFVERSQSALPEKFESTRERESQFGQPLKKLQMFQREKFSNTLILKPEIISTQELPVAPSRESQVLAPDKSKIRDEKISQFTPVKISQSILARIEELPDALLNESMAVPAQEHQIIHLNESEDTTMTESEIGSSLDKEIPVHSVKESKPIHLKQLEISSVEKFKELQNIPMRKFQCISTETSEIPPLNEVSIVASTEKSHKISEEDIKESNVTPNHELRKVSVEESHVLPAETPTISVKEHRILHEKESEVASTFETESMVQNPFPTELQISSLKKSDTVSAAKTGVNNRKKIINAPEKQPLITSDAFSDSEKNDETNIKISHDTSKGKKSADVITWVATAKTVVRMGNVQTEKKHMTGRGLRFLHEKTGLDEFNLTVLIGAITSVYLMVGEDAQILANAILTLTPILLTYSESGYYFIKVVSLALLFLHPFDGAERILWYIRLAHTDQVEDEPTITPFNKEELSEILKKHMDRQSLPLSKQMTGALLIHTPFQTSKLNDSTFHMERSDYSPSYDNVPEDKNPMLSDSEFRIQDQEVASAEGLSTNYNPHDLAFEPTKYLIFNAPFDFENLTYFIRIRNTSTKYIAYAIKSNAIPRVSATPPCGILSPKQKCDIAVTVKVMISIITPFMKNYYNLLQKMDQFVEQLVRNDRLAFDYVFCPPETKKFKFKLLQVYILREIS